MIQNNYGKFPDFSNEYEQSLDAFVYTCGYEKCEPSHSYGPVIRSGYMIHSILDGKESIWPAAGNSSCPPEMRF